MGAQWPIPSHSLQNWRNVTGVTSEIYRLLVNLTTNFEKKKNSTCNNVTLSSHWTQQHKNIVNIPNSIKLDKYILCEKLQFESEFYLKYEDCDLGSLTA